MIQETKVGKHENKKMIQKQKYYDGTTLEAIGASGGICTIWNKRKWDLVNQKISTYWIRTDLKNINTKEEYCIINIYSPNHYRDEEQYWNSVKEEATKIQIHNLILGGDLNLIRNTNERFGGKFYNDPSRRTLEEIIEDQKLINIPPSNGKYTWSNKRTGKHNIKESLDRILMHENIAATYSMVKSKIVHPSASYHKLVVLTLGKLENQGHLPFRYNKIWDNKEEFGKQIKESWKTSVTGSPQYVWETKLKNLRIHLKSWARENDLRDKEKKIELKKKWIISVRRGRENKRVSKTIYNKKRYFWNYISKIGEKKKKTCINQDFYG